VVIFGLIVMITHGSNDKSDGEISESGTRLLLRI